MGALAQLLAAYKAASGGSGRTVVATDNFNRADAGSLGSDWTDLYPGFATADINTNQCAAVDVSTDQSARWGGSGSFNDDQYAKMAIGARVWQNGSYRTGVLVRASADIDTARDFYVLTILHDNDIGSPCTTALGKMVNNTLTTLASDTSISWVVADTIELEVRTVSSNAQLKCFRNGVEITSLATTDSTSPFTTGKPGLYLQGNSTIRGDDWEGGNL